MKNSLLLTSLYVGAVMIAGSAGAATVVTCSNGTGTGVCTGQIAFSMGDSVNETKVYLDGSDEVTEFPGSVGGNNLNSIAQFTTDVDVDTGNGFANIKPTENGGSIGQLTFETPGYLFGNLAFDVQVDESGTGNAKEPFPLLIEVFSFSGGLLGSWALDSSIEEYKKSANQSFYLQLLDAGLQELSEISSVVISSFLDDEAGMKELKHFQVSGLKACIGGNCANGTVPEPVPLPAALPLLASGLGALGFLGWRRRRVRSAA